MAIQGQQSINVGYPNEAAGSDSLYTAFNKVKTNFETLFACSSPYSTVTGNTGIIVNANSTQGTVDIFNVGVVGLVAGTGIALSGTSNGGVYTGEITISATGVIGTVSSVGITSSTLQVSGSPITSSGNINVEIPSDLTLSGNVVANSVSVTGANLGSVDNLSITGGSANYVLSTDGLGNLSWVAQTGNGGGGGSTSNIYNGTSNVSINSSGGNITAAVGGTDNVVTITSSGMSVTGTLSSTGNANVGNLGTGSISATSISSTGNIQGSGNLIINGRANIIGNIGTSNVFAINLSVTGNVQASGGLSVTGNANVGTLLSNGNISAIGRLQVSNNIAALSTSNVALTIYANTYSAGTGAFAAVGAYNDLGESLRVISFGSNYANFPNLTGLYSSANTPIVFWQDGNERMRIASTGDLTITGNVGTAGTITATGTITGGNLTATGNARVSGLGGLVVTGNIFSSGAANSVQAIYAQSSGTENGSFAGVGSFNDVNTSLRLISFGSNYVGPNPGLANLTGLYSSNTTCPIVFWQNGTERMRVDSTGNVAVTNAVTANDAAINNILTVGGVSGGYLTGANLISANNFTSLVSLTATGNMQLAANLSQQGGTPISSANSVITHKIPIVINGVTYYIALTAAQ